MIQKFFLTFLVIIVSFYFVSCSKYDNTTPSSNSRDIVYEISGNFTGTIFASYTTAIGGTNNETISLPWTKTIVYNTSVDAAIIAISGNGGIIGQTITVIVKQNGIVKSTTTTTASGTTGSFSKSVPTITF